MEELVKLGPLIIKWNWISMLVSGLIGNLLVKQGLKAAKEEKSREILGMIGNSVLLSFGIWKFSIIFFNPISIINNPMGLLYFSGGYRGWILAVIFVFAYALYQSKKQSLPVMTYIRLYGLGFSSAMGTYHFISSLIAHTDLLFHWGEILLSVIFAGWFYKGDSENQLFQAVVWFGIGQIFIHFFKDVHVEVWLGLSREQFIFLVVSLIGFLGLSKRMNFKES